MTDTRQQDEDIAARLRALEADHTPDGWPAVQMRDISALLNQVDALRQDNAKLRTVMIAAAEEISRCWEAHCDAEGYGPVNLMRRLEEGIPSEYGYTAGAFDALRRERDDATQSILDEIVENLRLRELGGANPDENITAMTERLIRERDALRQRVEATESLLQDWVDSFAQHIEGGVEDELVAASLQAIARKDAPNEPLQAR